MSKSSRWIRALVVAVGLSASTACAVRGHGTVRTSTPPPPRAVVVESRPGYVWVHGNWELQNGYWVWRDGYWVRDRPGYVYIQGRWVHDGGRQRYVRGYWQPRREGHVWVPGAWVEVRGRTEWREGHWRRDDHRDARDVRRRHRVIRER